MQPRTIYQVLEETAAQFGDAPALRQPFTDKDGKREYLTYSWNQYQTAAEEIAAGLRSLGIRKGDIVALDSETRLEFYLADLGILANGSIAAALYPSYPPKDLVQHHPDLRREGPVRGRSQDACRRLRECAGHAAHSADRRGRRRADAR